MADIKYEITKELGGLSKSTKGWSKKLNMVSWDNRNPKFDLREWAPNHEKIGKGMTLNEDEAKALYLLLKEIFD